MTQNKSLITMAKFKRKFQNAYQLNNQEINKILKLQEPYTLIAEKRKDAEVEENYPYGNCKAKFVFNNDNDSIRVMLYCGNMNFKKGMSQQEYEETRQLLLEKFNTINRHDFSSLEDSVDLVLPITEEDSIAFDKDNTIIYTTYLHPDSWKQHNNFAYILRTIVNHVFYLGPIGDGVEDCMQDILREDGDPKDIRDPLYIGKKEMK